MARRHIPSQATVEIDTDSLRRRFRDARLARGLSQAATASMLRISQATISSFELGKYAAVRDETLLAVRALLDDWQRTADSNRSAAMPRIVVIDSPGGCVWCDSPLPYMSRPVRFCPLCGGRQTQSQYGMNAPDAQTRCCINCGRPVDDAAQPSPSSQRK